MKTKDLEASLGDPKTLRSVDETRAGIAQGMTHKLEAFIKDVERDAKQRIAVTAFRKTELVARHQDERQKLWAAHEKRWQAETRQRAKRLPKGFSGIWHRLTGQYAKIRAQNEAETLEAWQRDRAEKDALVFKQLEERQCLQRDIKTQRSFAHEELMRLREDVANYRTLDRDDREHRRERARGKREESERRRQSRDQRTRRRRGFEP